MPRPSDRALNNCFASHNGNTRYCVTRPRTAIGARHAFMPNVPRSAKHAWSCLQSAIITATAARSHQFPSSDVDWHVSHCAGLPSEKRNDTAPRASGLQVREGDPCVAPQLQW